MSASSEKKLTIDAFSFMDRFVKLRIGKKRDNKKNRTSTQKIKNEIVGMEEVREQVFDIVNMMKYNKIRTSMNISGSVYHNVHAMLGAPGTAKTTMAKLMGQMMVEEGLLKDRK